MTKRWSETQHLVAKWFEMEGWAYAEPVGNGRPGVDVTGMPGLGCEVKAEDGWRPTTWLGQARGHGGLPFVVQRPKGYGPASLAKWPVIVDLETFTALLKAAGYGTQDDDCPICHDTYTDAAGVQEHLSSGRKGCGPALENLR